VGLLSYENFLKQQTAESQLSVLQQTTKVTSPEPVSITFSGVVNGGTPALVYTVPYGRRLYIQSLDLFTGPTRGAFYMYDVAQMRYGIYESGEWTGAAVSAITRQQFPSPITFNTNVYIDFSAGAYSTLLTLIGYLL